MIWPAAVASQEVAVFEPDAAFEPAEDSRMRDSVHSLFDTDLCTSVVV